VAGKRRQEAEKADERGQHGHKVTKAEARGGPLVVDKKWRWLRRRQMRGASWARGNGGRRQESMIHFPAPELHQAKCAEGISIDRYPCPKRVGCFGSSTRFQMRKVVGK
jgi:hypothetical protein